MKITKLLPACAVLALASSCTTAGPFVTSISSDGRGNLIVEKSHVKLNAFMGTVSNQDTTTTSIKLIDLEKVNQLIESSKATQTPAVFE